VFPTALIPASMAFLSTCLGGLFALRVRGRLHLLLGFSSGAMLGVVLFDILPEVAEQAGEQQIDLASVLLFTAAGYMVFFALERITKLHSASTRKQGKVHLHGSELGTLRAAGLSLHSFLDGVAIAVGFHSGTELGNPRKPRRAYPRLLRRPQRRYRRTCPREPCWQSTTLAPRRCLGSVPRRPRRNTCPVTARNSARPPCELRWLFSLY
jgi:hypothetical protein